MFQQHDDFEVCGAGTCCGEGTRAEYEWTPRGWLVTYSTDEGEPLGSSTDAEHPSLGLLGLDDEARVIDVVMAWLWALDFGEA